MCNIYQRVNIDLLKRKSCHMFMWLRMTKETIHPPEIVFYPN
jgi:hypothetical protein